MTSRFKWLIPILILSLLVMSVLPSVSCTPGDVVYMLLWSVVCGIQVHIDGEYQGTLGFVADWGACMLLAVSTVGTHILDFTVPGSLLAASASDKGIELKGGQTTDIPDMTVTYDGVIAPGGRCEINLYYPQELITGSAMRLSGESENQPPLLAGIVVETSSEPFEPQLLINPSICCEPSSFIVMLQPDTAWSTTMRIGNQGGTILTYNLTDSLIEAIPTELIYDDGEANGAAWAGGSLDRDAVRFTPVSYPASVKTARIRLWPNSPDSDHEQFAIEVYDDKGPGGAPGNLLGTVNNTATNWDWWDVDISELGITIGSGDFYIAFYQLTACPDCEVVSRDFDYPHYGRSWSKCEGCSSWSQHSSENFMIRCVVATPQDCPWLNENPKSGSVDPDSWDDATVAIDASGLAPGEYNGQIVVLSNDPQNNLITVPLTLLVNRPPSAPGTPTPPVEAANVHTDIDLSWTGGDPDPEDTVTYDVHFGTTSSPPLVSGNQGAPSYDPGMLVDGTRYYWKVVTRDNHGITREGPVWDFTTSGLAPDEPGPEVGFADLIAEGKLVIAYNFDPFTTVPTAANGWTWYDPTLPPSQNNLAKLHKNTAYWVKVTEECWLTYGTWNQPHLAAGWNNPVWLGC